MIKVAETNVERLRKARRRLRARRGLGVSYLLQINARAIHEVMRAHQCAPVRTEEATHDQ